jgi:Leu/Phe-tRNA-protein transferase
VFDVQFLTLHLASLGAYEIPRARYLELSAEAARRSVKLEQVRHFAPA